MPVSVPETSIELSKSTAKTRKIIETRATEFNQAEAAYQQDAETYRSMSLEDSPKNFTETGDVLRQRRIDLLVSELSIRTDIDELFPALKADQQAAAELAFQRLEKVRADTLNGLFALGYVEGQVPGTNNLCITPGMINVNPRVFAARGEYDSACQTSYLERQRLNSTRIDEIRKDLERIRSKALNGV